VTVAVLVVELVAPTHLERLRERGLGLVVLARVLEPIRNPDEDPVMSRTMTP
jgi:hypothetical protein